MLVVLAKLTSPETVGRFALGLAITAPVIMFTNLQLEAVQATDANREYAFGDYLSLRLIMTALAFAIVVIISVVSGYARETIIVVLLVGLSKAVEAISGVYYGLFQQRERMDRMAISMMIKGPLSLLALGATVYFTKSMAWGVVGLVVAWLTLLFAYDIPNGLDVLHHDPAHQEQTHLAKVKLHLTWHFPTLRRLAWLSAPLGVVMMLISLNVNIPRYVIEHSLGERELGIFAALAYLIVAGTMIVVALGQSASPRLAQYYADKDERAFRTLLLKLILVGALLGVLGVIVALIGGKPLLTLLYQPEYAEQLEVFVLLMVAGGLGYIASFLGYGMTAARYFRVQTVLIACVSIATLLASIILIPGGGLVGAAEALILAAIVQIVGGGIVILASIRKLRGA
jgi:O-antigen/teichoic acid export membrane protein